MEERLYIRVRGQIQGPFDREKLFSLAQRGQFARHYEVSTDREVWVRASTYPDLFPRPKARPAPRVEVNDGENADASEGEVSDLVDGDLVEPLGWYYTNQGKESGPVSLDELMDLANSGRLLASDYVWTAGMAEWELAEKNNTIGILFDTLERGGSSGSEPLITPSTQSKRANAPMAVASFVLGLLGTNILFFLGSILGIVFGHVALRQIKESDNQLSGKGMAIAGLVLGYTVVIASILVTTVLLLMQLPQLQSN